MIFKKISLLIVLSIASLNHCADSKINSTAQKTQPYTKKYLESTLIPTVEQNIGDLKSALNTIYWGGTVGKNTVWAIGKLRGATELELEALDQFNVLNTGTVFTDLKTYTDQLSDTDLDKILKQVDTLTTTNVDDVIKFQNETYKELNKETAFTRLIQSAHFSNVTKRKL